MVRFGIKSMSLVVLLEVIVACLFNGMVSLISFLVLFLLIDVIFFGVIGISRKKVVIYSLLSLFKGIRVIDLSDIQKVDIKSGGLTPSGTDINFYRKDNKKKAHVFLLIYSFEKKKLHQVLVDNGITVNIT